MKAPDGTYWIGSAHPFDLAECYLNFRADVALPDEVRSARLHLSADSRYRLWINGCFVGRGPERSWPSSMSVDVRDVASYLKPGPNHIAVQVYSPGYSHFAYVHRGATGLICWLETDGTVLLRSDGGWRVQRDRSWSDRVLRVSIYGSGVEVRDMTLAEDWIEADISAWDKARVVQADQGPVWASLRARATALPVEAVRPLREPWQTRVCRSVDEKDDPHADVRATFSASTVAKLPPVLPRGQSGIWIFDLGESRSCVAGVEVTAAGGERLLISYAEKLREGQLLLSDPATYCRMRPTDRFLLRPGRQAVEGFTPRGARYVVFALDGGGVAPEPFFFVRLPRYPLDELPLPRLADPTLDAVAAVCRRTTLACLQDGFVDGVWRESSLWLGDAVAQDRALRAISDDPRPLLFTLDMAAEGADAEGFLPSVLPGEIPAYAVTDYGFSWIELLDGVASHAGVTDIEALWRRHWPTLGRLLRYMAVFRGDDGLLRNPPGRRLFLDWSAMDRREPNLTLNLRHLYALQLACGMADRTGARDAAAWRSEAQTLTRSLRRLKGTQSWHESPGGDVASQLALAFLILTGVAKGSEADDMADGIVARSLDASDLPDPDKPALASPFMHHYLFMALDRLGRRADIRAIIAARWGLWTDAGQPTTPENWSIDFPDGSACHGFSAHPLGWLALDREGR